MGAGNTKRKETKAMVKHYQLNHKLAMKAQTNDLLKVADWGWVNLDKVIDYVLELKYKYKANGLRIYFGAHGEGLEGLPASYIGYNNVILVGTQGAEKDPNNYDLPENAFESEATYSFTIGVDSHRLIDDSDRTHLHPPDETDKGDTILQELPPLKETKN